MGWLEWSRSCVQEEQPNHLRKEVYSDPERGEVAPVHLWEVSAIEEESAAGREELG